MFSFLSSISFWVASALAIPLAIHFLGQQKLKRKVFPSLLLIREQLAESMRRNRLKNILLLLIRTLLIACLLLALARPLFSPSKKSVAPEQAIFINYNGAYALAKNSDEKSLYEIEQAYWKSLDSASPGKLQIVQALNPIEGNNILEQRFGSLQSSVQQSLSQLPNGIPTRLYLPIFAWNDFQKLTPLLLQALQQKPYLSLSIVDFTENTKLLQAFNHVELTITPEKLMPQFQIQLQTNYSWPDKKRKIQMWQNENLVQEIPIHDDTLRLPIPSSTSTYLTGHLGTNQPISTDEDCFTFPNYYYAIPKPELMQIFHAGKTSFSLPSLGEANPYIHIQHFEETETTLLEKMNGPAKYPALIFLSNARILQPAYYNHLLEFVRQGGFLVLSVGNQSDKAALNRYLLQPLGMGQIKEAIHFPNAKPIQIHPEALTALKLSSTIKMNASLNQQFSYAAQNQTNVLLSCDNNPLLILSTFHRGRVLLWTTDIDDLNNTDIGVQGFMPLLHQHFAQKSWQTNWQNHSVVSDSIITLEEKEDAHWEIFDPEDKPFLRTRRDGQSIHVGPFSKLGVYKAYTKRPMPDSVFFAVNIQTTPSIMMDEAELKEQALRALSPLSNRLFISSYKAPIHPENSHSYPLFHWLILIAILLFFLEGVLSILFRLNRV